MFKLSKKVDGHTIRFVVIPKIFTNVFIDSPTGSLKLANSEVAYWRLDKDVSSLKKLKNGNKELCMALAEAFMNIIQSKEFGAHYGTNEVIGNINQRIMNFKFKDILEINTSKVEYTSSVNHKTKNLTETLRFNLANDIVFNAYKGFKPPFNPKGIKGKVWLNDYDDKGQPFQFAIGSPSFKLEDHIDSSSLEKLIAGRLRNNLPALAHNPKVEIGIKDEDDVVHHTLEELEEKYGHKDSKKKNKNHKTNDDIKNELQKHLTAIIDEINKEVLVLDKETFSTLTDDDKNAYLDVVVKWINDDEHKHLAIQALTSGILSEEYINYYEGKTDSEERRLSLPEWIGIQYLKQDCNKVMNLLGTQDSSEG